MRATRHTSDEQYQLILECRNSGLSDYQWCTDHGIKPGTFYNWVKRLRKTTRYDIPPAASRGSFTTPEKQEVVKLEILPEHPEPMSKQKTASALLGYGIAPVIEISYGPAVVRITNDISPQLLSQILCTVGGFPC